MSPQPTVKPYRGPKLGHTRCDADHPSVEGVTCHLDEGMHVGKPHRGTSLEPFAVHEWGEG